MTPIHPWRTYSKRTAQSPRRERSRPLLVPVVIRAGEGHASSVSRQRAKLARWMVALGASCLGGGVVYYIS